MVGPEYSQVQLLLSDVLEDHLVKVIFENTLSKSDLKITYNLVLILVRIMTTRYHDQGSE